MKCFIKSILAGLAISLGGWLYLCVNNKMDNNILAAFLFSFGLILICNFGFNLYTGKICYLFSNQEKKFGTKLLDMGIILLGNLVGTVIFSLSIRLSTSSGNGALFSDLEKIVDTKIGYVWYEALGRAFFCGMLVYIAVEGFKTIENNFGKYVVLVLAIGGFIICGFEHSIANMFYYFLALNFTFKAFLSILLFVIGNSIGGLFIPFMNGLMNLQKEE